MVVSYDYIIGGILIMTFVLMKVNHIMAMIYYHILT